MALSESTKNARRVDQGQRILNAVDRVLDAYERLDDEVEKFIGQELHINTDTGNAYADDDTEISGDPSIVWSELYEAKDVRDYLQAQILDSGTTSLTASDIATIAAKRGHTA